MITLGALNEIGFLRHAFFTRSGGVSQGIYASNNCGPGSGDAPAAVWENRARCMRRLEASPDRLATCHQIHSAEAVVVENPWSIEDAPHADGMATATPGLALGILTADCAPVLFADTRAKVVGAAHAGWRGAHGGVLEATLKAMAKLGARPRDIVAAVGPCIAQRSYEVGPSFPDSFIAEDPVNRDYFSPAARSGHWLFDLPGYITKRLGDAGVGLIQRCPNDTYAEEDRFFSYRRSSRRGEADYGRGMSVIMIHPPA
jgi:polyphenol oxidase